MTKLVDKKIFYTNQFNYYWKSVIFPTLYYAIVKQPSKLINVILAVLERTLKRSKLHCKPFMFKIEASAVCNLKCPLCVKNKSDMLLPEEKWMKHTDYLIMHDKIKESALRISFYIFGEALVNPYITEIIKSASADNIYTYFSSNFNLATKEKIKELINGGIGEVSVALDGWTQSQYETYRVGGDVNVVREAISYLMNFKRVNKLKWPLLKVSTIKFDYYKEDMDKIKRFCVDANVDSYVIKPNLEFVPCHQGPRPYSNCFWPWYTMFIDTDGTVYPCTNQQRKRNYNYGNILKDSLEDIWNSDLYIKMRKFLVYQNKDQFGVDEIPCLDCLVYN